MLKKLPRFISFFLIFIGVEAFHFPGFIQEGNPVFLIDRISKQLDSHPQYEKWKATVVSTTTEMDKKWHPKKVTVVKKILKVVKEEKTEQVLKALETKKGVTRDVTKKYIKGARKQREKAKKKEQKRKLKGKNENNENKLELSWDEIFPFEEEKRKNFDFIKLEDTYIGDLPVYVIESTAKVKDIRIWEGKYYIHKDSFEVIRTELKPSKTPKHVKEFEMEMSFQVIQQGYFVLKKSKMRISGGIFIKHIRMTVEEEYSEYEIVN